MVPDISYISADHNPATIPTVTGAAVSKGRHHAPFQANAIVCATLWLMDDPIAICAMTHPTSIVTLHPTLATSPTDITYVTIPQTRAGLTPATLTALLRKHSQEKASHTQDPTTPHKPHCS